MTYFNNFSTEKYFDLEIYLKKWTGQFCRIYLSYFTEISFLFYPNRLPHYALESSKLWLDARERRSYEDIAEAVVDDHRGFLEPQRQ